MGAEAIGYMLAYACMIDTHMSALVGSVEDEVYELFSSFNSAENKAEILRLVQSNEPTACEEEELLIPHRDADQCSRAHGTCSSEGYSSPSYYNFGDTDR